MGNLMIPLKIGQRVQIGEAVVTYVKNKSGQFIMLGIEAPESIKISRKFYLSEKPSEIGKESIDE